MTEVPSDRIELVRRIETVERGETPRKGFGAPPTARGKVLGTTKERCFATTRPAKNLVQLDKALARLAITALHKCIVGVWPQQLASSPCLDNCDGESGMVDVSMKDPNPKAGTPPNISKQNGDWRRL